MRIARYIIIIVVLAGMSVGSYAFLNRGIKKPDAEVPVTDVAKGQFRVTVREVGYLKAKKTAAVTTNRTK